MSNTGYKHVYQTGGVSRKPFFVRIKVRNKNYDVGYFGTSHEGAAAARGFNKAIQTFGPPWSIVMFDDSNKYERFVYKIVDGGDLAPPHGVWDSVTNEWAGIGTWSTEVEARACARGMNWAREKSRQGTRGLKAIEMALKQAQAAVARIS
jgi:hypothetical protein